MARTNIEPAEELLREVMHRYGVPTKREAVDLALRPLVAMPTGSADVRSLHAIGWAGDLDEMRGSKATE